MATGVNTPGTFSNVMPTVYAEARNIREQKSGTWERVTTVKRQTEGTGTAYNWVTINQIDAQDITNTTNNQNFQQFVASVQNASPEMTQVIIKITDRTYRQVPDVITSKFGPSSGRAMERKKNQDFLSLASTFATTTSPGSGNPFGSSYITAAARNATSNTTEPAMSVINTVAHGFQIYDLEVEQNAPIGTYAIPAGMTEQVFRNGWRGKVSGSNVFEDGLINIDSVPDANAFTLAREGVYSIMAMTLKREQDRDIYYGGGADVLSMTDEYAFAENKSGNSGTTQVFCYLHKSDATAPTG